MKKIFDNMKIKTEVIVSFTAVLILALFVGLVGFWGLMGIKQSSHELYKFDALDLHYSARLLHISAAAI
jgi:CHASE3 domain sensor protein